MSIEALVASLSRLDIFRGLEAHRIHEIARRAERVVYKPGDFLIEDGCPGEAAILIVTGQAVRVSGPGLAQRAHIVEPGSLLGEMAMLIETEHSSTVIARSPVRALRLLRSDILELMAEDTKLADHFVRIIAGRLATLAGELRGIDEMLADGPHFFPSSLPRLPIPHHGHETRVH